MFRAFRIFRVYLAVSLLIGIPATLLPRLAAQPPSAPPPAPAAPANPGPVPALPAAEPVPSVVDSAARGSALPPLVGRPSQAHVALNRAIEYQRRGDYETAAPLFLEAQRRQADLTLKEQKELVQLMQENTQSVQARRDAADNLRLAEKALSEGRQGEVAARLHRVTMNEQYLLPADRQRYQGMMQQTRRTGPGVPAPATPSGGNYASVDVAQSARDKIKQARTALGQFQFENAEALAHEAERLNQSYARGEDTPPDVLRDVGKARSDPKTLVAGARAALNRKELDQAEQLAQLAEHVQSRWSFQLWGDTPAKVLKEVQAARAEQKERDKVPAAEPATTAQNPPTPPKEGSKFSWLNPFGGKNKTDSAPAVSDDPKNNKPSTVAGSQQPSPANSGAMPPPVGGQQPSLAAQAAGTPPGPGANRTPQPGPAALPRAQVSNPGEQAPTRPQQPLVSATPPPLPPSLRTEPLPPNDMLGLRAERNAAANLPQARVSDPGPAPASPGPLPSNVQVSQVARPNTSASSGPAPSSRPAPLPAESGQDQTEEARALIVQARKAMQQGNFTQARQLIDQARQLKTNLTFSEDTPERVAADLARIEALAAGRGDKAGPQERGVETKRKQEAVELVKQSRALLDEGKIDEATQLMLKAKGITVDWGLFDQTPDSLKKDLDKARAKRDQEEAEKLLVEARRLLAAGEFAAAKSAAYKAQHKHGPYGRNMLDPRVILNDTPTKVLVDIEAAEQKQKLLGGPAKRDTALANNQTRTPGGLQPAVVKDPHSPTGQGPAKADTKLEQARLFLVDARQALQKGDTKRAAVLVDYVKSLNVRFNPGEDTPETISRDIELAKNPKPPVDPNGGSAVAVRPQPPAGPGPLPPPAGPGPIAAGPTVGLNQGPRELPKPNQNQQSGPGGQGVSGLPPYTALVGSAKDQGQNSPGPQVRPGYDNGGIAKSNPLSPELAMRRPQAIQLLRQARELMAQREPKLIDARAKALEAEKLGAPFGPQEDSPGLCLQQLASMAQQRIQFLITNGPDVAKMGRRGMSEAERYLAAENCFLEAKQLALTFGQDVKPCDDRLAWLATQRSGQSVAVAPTDPRQAAPVNKGQQLLEDARRDLKAADTKSALGKALAAREEVGCKELADALIRTIEAEEYRQRVLEQQRAFDAAVAAYVRREYSHAQNILAHIDPLQLDNVRRDRMRNIMNTPEMKPRDNALAQMGGPRREANDAREPLVNPSQPDIRNPRPNGGGEGNIIPLPLDPGVGRAQAEDRKPPLLENAQGMRVIQFQKLRQESIKIQADASEKFKMGDTNEALEMLQAHLTALSQENLDPNQLTLLKRPIESRIDQYRMLRAQQEFYKDRGLANKQNKASQHQKYEAAAHKEKQVKALLDQFTKCYKEGKYEEAETAARKAHELDPDNSTAAAAILLAENQSRITAAKSLHKRQQDANLEMYNRTEEPPPMNAIKEGVNIDKKRWDLGLKRGASISSGRKSEKEREIEHRLTEPVTLNFADTPLRQVIEDIRTWKAINIHVDEKRLLDEGVSLDQRMTIKLEQVSLKSALNLLLRSSRLTYVIRDEVLQITTERDAQGKLDTRTFNVADLVIPFTSFGDLSRSPLTPVNGGMPTTQTPVSAPSPIEPLYGMNGGMPVSSASPSFSATVYGSGGNNAGPQWGSSNNQPVRQNAPAPTQERQLIELITKTIAPGSWSEMGGPGTIDYHPLTMSLVINQTQDLQEQIQDLLQALRRLQDQEVAVEVKVVSISEDWFEQIGVQFTMNIPTNSAGLAQQIANGFQPGRLVAGITPAGNLTNDLSIPITNNVFARNSLPFFGGGTGVPGFGGVTMGLAFLSDLQVFLFMEAAQADSRTNVMQAPKLTLFNGQTATMQVQEAAPFVSNVTATVQNGLVLFTPNITPVFTGVGLTLQAVISGDRRFVRMSLNPTFNVPVPGPVQLFPIVVPVFPLQQIGPGNMNPIVFTQMIHLPVTNSITVGTTVMVPDGGTVVLGGLKLLSEARTEFGPPVLSKIPYINRLFRNVAYGKDTSSLLIMVTPRIIIMEEEQEYQTGYVPPVAVNP